MASWRETPLEMDTQLARVTLKKKQQQQKTKQKRRKQKKRGKIKKKGLSLRILPWRNSFDDKTCIRSRHVTIQMSFGQAR